MQSCIFVRIMAGWSLFRQAFKMNERIVLGVIADAEFLVMIASIFIQQFGPFDGHYNKWFPVGDILCWLLLVLTLKTRRLLQRSLRRDGIAASIGGLLPSFDKLVGILGAYSVVKMLLFTRMTCYGYKVKVG